MPTVNFVGNKAFCLLVSWVLRQRVSDTLCGTKALLRRDYESMPLSGGDRWGDFDLLFGAARQKLRILEIPIHYHERVAGESKMNVRREGPLFLGACLTGWRMLRRPASVPWSTRAPDRGWRTGAVARARRMTRGGSDGLLALYERAARTGALDRPRPRRAFESLYLAYKRLIEAGPVEGLRELVPEGSTVVDVGANIGFFSLRFARWVGPAGRVIAIEPEARNIASLRARVERAGLSDVVDCIQAAAADRSGVLRLALTPGHPGDHHLAKFGEPVQAVTARRADSTRSAAGVAGQDRRPRRRDDGDRRRPAAARQATLRGIRGGARTVAGARGVLAARADRVARRTRVRRSQAHPTRRRSTRAARRAARASRRQLDGLYRHPVSRRLDRQRRISTM